eukprot:CAMPEP_0197450566 /NCGR_PEP_ID=MMETSP1175-20131217/25771_1 /TAXON_ID=1003142 /ORGANISM="Triceratium dubium, Strain CCMP147" /LENGTH=77 /DNA_ID=CAMNT_0042983015 /DNA_START=54 /DNA_END=284 /DNA_ORIENTATION=+
MEELGYEYEGASVCKAGALTEAKGLDLQSDGASTVMISSNSKGVYNHAPMVASTSVTNANGDPNIGMPASAIVPSSA